MIQKVHTHLLSFNINGLMDNNRMLINKKKQISTDYRVAILELTNANCSQ